jgi:uncharacterized protein YkwD
MVYCFGGKVMLRQKAVCLACVGAGLFILLGTGVSAAAGPQDTGQDLAAIKAEMIRLTNAERAKAKLPPLVEDGRLSSAAQKHTEFMAAKMTLDNGGGGTSLGQRVKAEKFNWKSVHGVIDRADRPEAANAAKAIQGWMSSTTGHRKAILDPRYTHIGVGVEYSPAGVPYYTEVFALPMQAISSSLGPNRRR